MAIWASSLISAETVNGQGWGIIDRKNSLYVQPEFLMVHNFAEFLGIDLRYSAGYSRQITPKMEMGIRIMSAKTKIIYQPDEEPFYSYESRGGLKMKGAELVLKRYHKNGEFVPFGRFLEFSVGLNMFIAESSVYYKSVEIPHDPYRMWKKIIEPDREIKTLSVGFKFGKQWLFENHFFLNTGVSFRLHFVTDEYFDPTFNKEDFQVSSKQIYIYSIFSRDVVTSFVSLGYFF